MSTGICAFCGRSLLEGQWVHGEFQHLCTRGVAMSTKTVDGTYKKLAKTPTSSDGMTPQEAVEIYYEVPLLELLRGVGTELRTLVDLSSTHSRSIPIGSLCNRAADKIEELEGKLTESARQERELVARRCIDILVNIIHNNLADPITPVILRNSIELIESEFLSDNKFTPHE